MYTLGNLISDVQGRVNNETTTVTGGLITMYANEALRTFRTRFEFPSAEVITQLPLMAGVYFYSIPYEGYKEFIALRDNYRIGDSLFFRNVSEDAFWSQLQSGNTKSESNNGGTRRLLFNLVNPAPAWSTLNAANGVDTDGTWVASGDASNARTDTLYVREGSGSLAFDVTYGTGTATLSNTTMTPRNLSGDAFKNTGILTPWLFLPSYVGYTGFTVRFGSDLTANYWEISTSTQIDSSSLSVAWNQLGFDWQNATKVGSPDASAISAIRFSFTVPAAAPAQTALRLNNFVMRQRRIVNLHSTTDYLVIDGTTSLPKESFINSSDTSSYFNIDRDFIDLLQYEILEEVFTTSIDDKDARAFYADKRTKKEADLLILHPSKRQPEVQTYGDTSQHDAWLRRGRGR